jgi:drug/metabolite transporter (DMT)-like permease
LIALVAALFVLVRDLLTRKIPVHIPTPVVTFATALVAVPIGLAGIAAEPWIMPGLFPFLVTVGSAAFLVFAFILMVVAFRGTDVTAISPFRYSLVVFAVIFGIILFSEIPDAVSFVGMGIIVAAGVYMLHWETRQRRGATASAVAATQPPE